jgi:hypothetical protein
MSHKIYKNDEKRRVEQLRKVGEMKKTELYVSLKEAKENLNDAIDIFTSITKNKDYPEDVKEKVNKILLAISIDTEEISRIKNFISKHD